MTDASLYVVATPIGNLDDLSPRARRVLAEVDLIAAEDTRHTGRLLSQMSIDTPQIALHDHNEEAVIGRLIEKMRDGASIALVSDAGTPLVSDPGYRLVRAAHENALRVSPLPGPSASVAALSVSGLATDRFAFEGFLPGKRAARIAQLRALRDEPRTLVFFESVHRISACLQDLCDTLGEERHAFIGRELTKLHEQCVSTTLGDLNGRIDSGDITSKGEFVVVVEGAQEAPPERGEIDVNQLLAELCAILPNKQAVEIVSRASGRRRNEIYQMMLDLKRE